MTTKNVEAPKPEVKKPEPKETPAPVIYPDVASGRK